MRFCVLVIESFVIYSAISDSFADAGEYGATALHMIDPDRILSFCHDTS